jgi:hypothetical protein
MMLASFAMTTPQTQVAFQKATWRMWCRALLPFFPPGACHMKHCPLRRAVPAPVINVEDFFMTPAEIEATAHQAVALSHVRLHWFLVPFGYLTVRHGKSQFLIGKPSINGPFSMAMLNSQMVNQPIFKLSSCHLF